MPLTCTEEAGNSFDSMKDAIANAALLTHPSDSTETSVMVDALDKVVGAVPQQIIGDRWHLISFLCRKLYSTEQRYSSFGQELLAICLAIKHFWYFLEGQHFHMLTNHKPLTYSGGSINETLFNETFGYTKLVGLL